MDSVHTLLRNLAHLVDAQLHAIIHRTFYMNRVANIAIGISAIGCITCTILWIELRAMRRNITCLEQHVRMLSVARASPLWMPATLPSPTITADVLAQQRAQNTELSASTTGENEQNEPDKKDAFRSPRRPIHPQQHAGTGAGASAEITSSTESVLDGVPNEHWMHHVLSNMEYDHEHECTQSTPFHLLAPAPAPAQAQAQMQTEMEMNVATPIPRRGNANAHTAHSGSSSGTFIAPPSPVLRGDTPSTTTTMDDFVVCKHRPHSHLSQSHNGKLQPPNDGMATTTCVWCGNAKLSESKCYMCMEHI